MTSELLEAIEAVRRYDAGDGAVGSHDHERVSAAFRLLARYLVEHAGELVRVKTCALNLFDEWQTTPLVGAKIEAKVDIPFKTKGQVRCFLIGLGYNRNFIP